jgi:hypothetical protein
MIRDRAKGDFEKFCEPIKLWFCEALEFPSQVELTHCEHRFKVLRFPRVERPSNEGGAYLAGMNFKIPQ